MISVDADVVRATTSLMHVRAVEKGLGLTLEISPDLPRNVSADAGKLRQVLINLLGNAIKFTKRGGRVSLRAKLACSDASMRARVRFEVEDSGAGIQDEDVKRIFAPFKQLGDRSRTEAGSGLGLFISKQYVELMGGQIGVDTEPGKGSVFCFEIPVRVSGPSPGISSEPPYRHVTGLAEGQPRHRLLIAEDQPENRLLLHKLLEPLGFDLRVAVNGREAEALAEQWHPHLIWMDIRMPELDGLQATRRIKTGAAGTRIKIVALTAHALEDERLEILAAGCDDFIRKPYRDTEIFEALARHLGVRFVYCENPAPAAIEGELSAGQLKKLPTALIEELREAAMLLEGRRCLEVSAKIEVLDRELGARLHRMVEDLQFKELLAMMDDQVDS